MTSESMSEEEEMPEVFRLAYAELSDASFVDPALLETLEPGEDVLFTQVGEDDEEALYLAVLVLQPEQDSVHVHLSWMEPEQRRAVTYCLERLDTLGGLADRDVEFWEETRSMWSELVEDGAERLALEDFAALMDCFGALRELMSEFEDREDLRDYVMQMDGMLDTLEVAERYFDEIAELIFVED